MWTTHRYARKFDGAMHKCTPATPALTRASSCLRIMRVPLPWPWKARGPTTHREQQPVQHCPNARAHLGSGHQVNVQMRWVQRNERFRNRSVDGGLVIPIVHVLRGGRGLAHHTHTVMRAEWQDHSAQENSHPPIRLLGTFFGGLGGRFCSSAWRHRSTRSFTTHHLTRHTTHARPRRSIDRTCSLKRLVSGVANV